MTITHLTTEQLAARWGMHVKSLSNWRVMGKGPRWWKNGPRKVLYPIAEVLAWEVAHGAVDPAGVYR